MGRVDGKVAFITGAARGQGRSHAIRLAEEGADIVAVDIAAPVDTVAYPMPGPEDLAQTAAEVEALNRRIVFGQVDVRDLDGLTDFLGKAVAELGRLDIVCANAGIYSQGRLADLDPQTFREMIDVNLTGVWHTCRAAIPHLLAGGRGGSIILTSSSVGLRATQHVGHYAAAKHGVIGLMRTFALELAPDSIRVNSVHPTAVDTPMIQNEALYRMMRPGDANPTREDVAPVLQSMNALPIPWVDPRDVSNAVLFLASDEARYITGVTFPVDAGLTIK
ncbi:MAG: mycofactocin-coupled SDR family oxidoreductase [Acidimicrobiaceae bacterium]|nr:mycofactocin-coupled SDR family oxidoreductase [Acidimicrobiaceae bacterium]